MNGSEFLRKIKRLSRKTGTPFQLSRQGKGSHMRITYGDGMTTIPDLKKEIKAGLFRSMCRDLGIDPRDL